MVTRVDVCARKLQFPARHNHSNGDTHLVVGEVRTGAAAVAAAKGQELERTVLTLKEPFGPKLIRSRVERWILMNGAYPAVDRSPRAGASGER
jgi:hypothetical protein